LQQFVNNYNVLTETQAQQYWSDMDASWLSRFDEESALTKDFGGCPVIRIELKKQLCMEHYVSIQELVMALLNYIAFDLHGSKGHAGLAECTDIVCTANNDDEWIIRMRVSLDLPFLSKHIKSDFDMKPSEEKEAQQLILMQQFADQCVRNCVIHGMKNPGDFHILNNPVFRYSRCEICECQRSRPACARH
jgi:hypothetical protein